MVRGNSLTYRRTSGSKSPIQMSLRIYQTTLTIALAFLLPLQAVAQRGQSGSVSVSVSQAHLGRMDAVIAQSRSEERRVGKRRKGREGGDAWKKIKREP